MPTFIAPSGATVRELDDLVSLSWEWTDLYEDFAPVHHRIVWIKDEVGLYFCTKNPEGKWINIPIRHADYQARNAAEARRMAEKFVRAGDD